MMHARFTTMIVVHIITPAFHRMSSIHSSESTSDAPIPHTRISSHDLVMSWKYRSRRSLAPFQLDVSAAMRVLSVRLSVVPNCAVLTATFVKAFTSGGGSGSSELGD